MEDVDDRWEDLVGRIRGLGGAVVAFSGGVDSSLVLAAAREALGEAVIAVIGRSATYPAQECEQAARLAATIGVPHLVIDTCEMDSAGFRANPPDRCYHCKGELFGKLRGIALKRGLACVLEGSNADDLRDHRPGRRAALELGVVSPLADAGLTKADVRAIARMRGLPNWDKPSLACLASRIPYGEEITTVRLARIENAEAALHALGFRQVRVRDHGALARIEVEPSSMELLLRVALEAVSAVKQAGYTWVSLDLEGYRTGAMNEALSRADPDE